MTTDRDIAIRTILGEALGEGPEGQMAVAHVLRNRAADPRWPSSIADVALQPQQFSAWNTGAGGNTLTDRYGPETPQYRAAAAAYDASARMPDITGGATHYYSPAGMDALVAEGSQSNTLPRWLQQETARRGEAGTTTIGGHIFTGLRQGERATASPHAAAGFGPSPAPVAPPSGRVGLDLSQVSAGKSPIVPVEADGATSFGDIGAAMSGASQQQKDPILAAQRPQGTAINRVSNDPTAYLKFFQGLS